MKKKCVAIDQFGYVLLRSFLFPTHFPQEAIQRVHTPNFIDFWTPSPWYAFVHFQGTPSP